MDPRTLRIEDFTYDLPDDRVAKYPLQQRDASKLLLYSDGNITEDTYRHIAAHIPQGALMVFNQTKVVHARLLFRKPTGGGIEVFCLAPHERYPDVQTAMMQKGEVMWECMVGGAGKWKHGMTLELVNDTPHFTLTAQIADRNPNAYILHLQWSDKELTFAEVLHHVGKVPLPPYLNREADAGDENRYQTLFARDEGSVAAPTAGLHFTPVIMEDIASKGIGTAFLTLHVGAGTFRPVKADTMEGHDMHAEWIEVTYATIQQLLGGSDPVIAVGTTSLRTLESLYWIGNKLALGLPIDLHGISVSQWEPYETKEQVTTAKALRAIAHYMQQQRIDKLITRTQILIAPGYAFRLVQGLVTNFHQPQSTLLLLVSAFIGADWRRIYDYALAHQFRFLSYGDGCLLWKK